MTFAPPRTGKGATIALNYLSPDERGWRGSTVVIDPRGEPLSRSLPGAGGRWGVGRSCSTRSAWWAGTGNSRAERRISARERVLHLPVLEERYL